MSGHTVTHLLVHARVHTRACTPSPPLHTHTHRAAIDRQIEVERAKRREIEAAKANELSAERAGLVEWQRQVQVLQVSHGVQSAMMYDALWLICSGEVAAPCAGAGDVMMQAQCDD